MSFDGAAFGREIVAAVKGHIDRSLSPLAARLDAMEARLDGMPEPRDGKDADPEVVRQMVADAVKVAFEAIPPAKDGEDGKSVAPEDLTPLVEVEVAKAVAELPGPPPDRGEEIEALRAEADALRAEVKALREAKPEFPRLLVDDAGELVAVMDGEPKSLGRVRGRDGRDAPRFASADVDADGVLRFALTDGETIRAGKVRGERGADGFGFEHMDFAYDGERRFALRFARGEEVKEFVAEAPLVLDRGVYRDGEAYRRGDAVTWAGSLWIAQRDLEGEKPEASDAWRLAVKRGRNGRDAEPREIKAGPVKGGLPPKGKA